MDYYTANVQQPLLHKHYFSILSELINCTRKQSGVSAQKNDESSTCVIPKQIKSFRI